jgi:hypothetical protein
MRLHISLSYFIVGICLLLAACQSDFFQLENRPPTPNYRVKRVVYEGLWLIGNTAEYNYVAGKTMSQATYSLAGGGGSRPVGSFTFDNRQRPTRYILKDPANTNSYSQTTFEYPNDREVIANLFTINSNGSQSHFQRITHTLTNGQVTEIRTESVGTSPGWVKIEKLTYANGDVVKVVRMLGNTTETETYTFDDKVNPLLGLYGPDITHVRRYSQHNVTKATFVYPTNTSGYQVTYTYNENNLPLRSTTTSTGTASTPAMQYEYEQY